VPSSNIVEGSGTPGITLFTPTSPPEASETATAGPLYLTEKTVSRDFELVILGDPSLLRLEIRFNSEKPLLLSDVLRFIGARFGFAWAVIPNALRVNAIANSIRRLITMRGRAPVGNRRSSRSQQLLYPDGVVNVEALSPAKSNLRRTGSTLKRVFAVSSYNNCAPASRHRKGTST